MSQRYGVLGLARVRARWFGEVSAWSNTGRVPIEFIKCVAIAELRARLDDVASVSALLVESHVNGLDRDLIDLARSRGIPTVVVDTTGDGTDWVALGAAAVLPERFGEAALVDTLRNTAQPVQAHHSAPINDVEPTQAAPQAQRIVVTGPNGSGTSTVAMALAQGLAQQRSVVLADLVRRGDMAMYHDALDVVPGLQELVEAHRSAALRPDDLDPYLFDIERRGYAIVLGLRRLRDWTALAPRATQATLNSLGRRFDIVIADIDHEVDGEAETGSLDIEERNSLGRLALLDSAATVVTAEPTLKGIHQMLHVIGDLTAFGVASASIVTVINRAPRSGRARAEIASSIAALCPVELTSSPVFVPDRRLLDQVHSTGDPLPAALVRPVVGAVLPALSGSRQAPSTRRAQPALQR